MPNFKITIADHATPQLGIRQFTGTFKADTLEEAKIQAQEFYAEANDTDTNSIEIKHVIQLS